MLDRVGYVVKLVSIPIIIIEWFLSCFSDSLPYEYIAPGQDVSNPTPELSASFLSGLTFHWLNPLIYLGYSRPLKLDDLYDIKPVIRTAHVFRKFSNYYKPSKSPSVILPLFRSFALEYVTTSSFKLMSCFLMFVNPLVLDYLLQWMVHRTPYWQGFFYAGLMFSCSIIDSMLLNQYEYRLAILSLKMRQALSDAIYKKALQLSPDVKAKYSTGQIVNLMAVDTHRVTEFILFSNNAWSAPLIIGIAVYLLWQQLGPSTIAGIGVIVLLIPINGWITMVWRKTQHALMAEKDKRSKILSEIFSGMRVFKLYGWEPAFKERVTKAREGELVNLKRQSKYMAGVTFSLSAAPIFVAIFTFITYTLVDSSNVLDPSKAFVSLTLFNILRLPMTFLPLLITFATMFFVSMKRISAYLASEEADHQAIPCITGGSSEEETKLQNNSTCESSDAANGTTAGAGYASDTSMPPDEYAKSAIWIRDGNFSWTSTRDVSNATLKDINLAIKKGSLVAVVGTVGSGKSSLLSALLNDMVKITGTGQVKGSTAFVPQQAWIQNATLKQNIIFTNKFMESKYKKIIDSTALTSDIKILPAGDDTEIGEKGINLSGGQKQRVSLARAVYSDADIYLLDDPLSAVDTHVGKHIFEKVIGPDGLLKNKTRLLVTHKVTLLPEVDFIIVMKDGKISESGSYHELLDKKGAFSEFLLEYLVETMDEEEDDQKIAEMKEKMRPELERHLSKVSGQGSSRGSETDLRARTTSAASSYKNSKNCSTKNSPEKQSSTSLSKKDTNVTMSPKGLASSQHGKLTEIELEATGSVPYSVYFSYFKAMGLLSTFIVLISFVISSSFNIASSLWLSYWADDVLYPERMNDTSLRNVRIAVFGVLGLSECFFQFVGNLIVFLATLTASRLLHSLMLDRIIRAPMSFFDTTPQGRILNRFTKDIDAIDTNIRMNIRQYLTSIFRSIVTAIIISIESPFFLVFVIPLALMYYLVQKYYVATSRQLKRIEATSRSPVYSHFSETVAGTTSIRAFGVSDLFINEFEARADLNAKSAILQAASSRWLAVRLEFLGSIIVLISALLAVTELGSPNPALAGLSISYALSVTQMLNMAVRHSVDLENNFVAAERIIEYTHLPTEAAWYNEATKPKATWPDQGHVVFDSYSTRYRDGLDLVLRKISFETKPAEKIGIVGRTGAGKSSITLAMFRLIEPVTGCINIDNIDITRIGLMDLRSKLTIIPQDPILFTGTLRLNLDPLEKFTDSDIWYVLEVAHLKDFVRSLDNGLYYEVAEGGENLSVGQRQLVCLARALLRQSKILILDEATAAVDLETDDLIQKTIRTEFARCTILTIAHRLNTVIDYDRILLLEDGQVAEFDTPQNLMSDTSSKFYSMAKTAGLIGNNNEKIGGGFAQGNINNDDDGGKNDEPKPGSSIQ